MFITNWNVYTNFILEDVILLWFSIHVMSWEIAHFCMILCKIFTLIYFSLPINRAIKNFTCLGLLLSMVSSLNYVFNFYSFLPNTILCWWIDMHLYQLFGFKLRILYMLLDRLISHRKHRLCVEFSLMFVLILVNTFDLISCTFVHILKI